MVVNVMIEIPKGSRNKYEFDKEKKLLKFDRMLFSPVHYPSDYGFILDTLALDGDSLDALVLVWEPTFPGCIIEAIPVGMFKMWDDKGPDEKILCVPVSDPFWNYIETLSDVPPHSKKTCEFNEPVSVEIFGTPSEVALAMMKKVAGAGIEVSIHPQFIGGWMHLKKE